MSMLYLQEFGGREVSDDPVKEMISWEREEEEDGKW